MAEAPPISLGHSLSEMSLTTEEVSFEIDPDSQERLYVAWASAPQPTPATRIEGQDDAPQEPVKIDVVAVFGLFDVPDARHKPLGWLCKYLERAGGDSRILHFKYRPSEVVAPAQGHDDIHTLSELLLCRLIALRVGDTVNASN
ncbi:hypothetical protein GGR58DRAFT_476433 [Xylaria digitata]|nr:hypothetical protein GGR58DRAFT_476433 [Xylaria digitata]